MAKYYFNEHNTYDKNKITSRKSVIEIDDEGNRTITTRITRNEKKTFKEKLKFGSSLFGKVLIVAICLFFGGYFFSGGFNSQVVSTQKESVIINELNGIDYDYNVKYVDYDYTTKLNQLSALKNVFTLEEYDTYNPNELLEYKSYLSLSIQSYINMGLIKVNTISFEDSLGNVIDLDYLQARGFFKIMYRVDPNNIAVREFDRFVNNYNLSNYIALKYGNNDITTFEGVINNVWSWFYRVFTILNAPIIWLGNFIYDIGVLIGFVFNW